MKNNENNSLALRNAAAKGEFEKLENILKGELTYDINAKSSTGGNTPLLWAATRLCEAVKEKNTKKEATYKKIILTLLDYGADDTVSNDNKENLFSLLLNDAIFLAKVLEKEARRKFTLEEDISYVNFALLASRLFFQIFSLKIHENYFNKEKINMLSLGCGICLDFYVLDKLCKIYGKELTYYGVDIDIDTENKQSFNSNFLEQYKNIKLFCADATNISELNKLFDGVKFNFGLMRNPDFLTEKRKEIFSKMMNITLPIYLEDQSPVLFTLGSEEETNYFSEQEGIKESIFYKAKSNNFSIIKKSILKFFAKEDETITISQLDEIAVILRFNEDNFKNLHNKKQFKL